MGAFVFNLFDFAGRTPEQMIRVFFELYDVALVREQLWMVFAGYVLADEEGGTGRLLPVEEVAALLDQLVCLVEAVARQRGDGAAVCACCGRV
jgi:hypothetical protein